MCKITMVNVLVFVGVIAVSTWGVITWKKCSKATDSTTQALTGKETAANPLVAKLNQALADEWVAFYQYWVAAKLVTGPTRDAVIEELKEHAEDEYRHAGMLTDRIIQLEGTPLMKLEECTTHGGCGNGALPNIFVVTVLNETIKGERCAISFYKDLITFIGGKDQKTREMIESILKDEIKHEKDLTECQAKLPKDLTSK